MNGVSKIKVIAGYAALLAMLLFSLFFVRREMETLMRSENEDMQWTDSLFALLREKDENTLRLLRMASEGRSDLISATDIEHIIAEQDTLVTQHRIQHRVVTHRDTTLAPAPKKGFFRRLGEAFVPSKRDSSIRVSTSQEIAVDTLLEAYNPTDSLQEKLRAITQQKKEISIRMQRQQRNLRRMDHQLTARIDTLLKEYEEEALSRARAEAQVQQGVRRRSAHIISGIAIGGVLLATLFLAIIGRDITRSNRYRRELEEARHRAEELLATREKLMLAITHDFKAPLGSIIGYADLLSRLTVDERQRFYLNNMKSSSEHLLKLVVDLLDFHRLDLHKVEINRVSFHPAHLLEEVRTSFEPLTAAKGLSLNCEVAPELDATFISDPLRLRQILTNLLSNAVKFTDQGSVTLTARYADRELVATVADTGRGMEATDRERIFQEFTRLPSAQGKEGFGLGLSIVRMLVQLLEGNIEVDSIPGQGSTFTLRIPLYPVAKNDDNAKSQQEGKRTEGKKVGIEQKKSNMKSKGDISQAVLQENASSPKQQSSFKKLLLIDDDRIQLSLTAAMLAQNGITSVTCLQIDELLDALRAEKFDALLTDVQMPACNGFDLLQLLRASNIPQAGTIPIIAVTARSDMQRQEFIAHGFTGMLHKPFSKQELFEELENSLPNTAGKKEWDTEKPVPEQEVTPKPPSTKHAATRQTFTEDATTDASGNDEYNLTALTAFASDDAEAAAAILSSFVSEKRLNATRLKRAIETQDTTELAAVSHKMIPVFTLIGAHRLVALLKELEGCRTATFTATLRQKAQMALTLLEKVPEQQEPV